MSVQLTEKQEEVYKLICKGYNIFISGVAGVGKGEIIKTYFKYNKDHKKIAVTSTTGTSALLINGTTIHSFAGIGLGKGNVENMITKIMNSKFLTMRWKKLNVLIIDEISMLSPELFDKLEEIARVIRSDPRPFGGIQLVLSGDFCFDGNTKILMSNGNIKLAKNILINDKVIGDDGLPKKVLRLFRGQAQMYEISFPRGGEDLIVTGNHILCLKHTNEKKILWSEKKKCWIVSYWNNTTKTKTFSVGKKYNTKEKAYNDALLFIDTLPLNDIIEITVNDFLKLPKGVQRNLACYKIGITNWPEYENCVLKIHPWLMGAWLGDGNSDGKGFTNVDEECIKEFTKYLNEIDCRVEKKLKPKYRYVIKNQRDNFCSPFKEYLKYYNLINNKHIPDEYMFADKNIRLELLAGLLDTDGSLTRNTFEISQTREVLANQICFLARSLGLSCSIKRNEQTHVIHANKDYPPYITNTVFWRCHIGGNIHEIPCRITRKKAKIIIRQYNPLWMKPKITPIHKDNFYGFEIEGNKRFLLGDFTITHNCQLPTIDSNKFCFESKSWNKCIDKIIYLKEIIRQTDPVFQNCLNNIRIGNITSEIEDILKSRIDINLTNNIGIKPTKIFSHNITVDRINNTELDKLSEDGREFREYEMEITTYTEKVDSEKYKKSCNASENLQLCIRCQVMLLYNMDLQSGLVNGSRGIVINFFNDLPVIKFLNGQERIIDYYNWEIEENDKRVATITQIPLKVAFAISCHKSQGISLDYAEIDLSNVFEYGQAYVALSRVKTLEGLSIIGLDVTKIKAHPKAVEFYNNLD
jgi:hypothetical protein